MKRYIITESHLRAMSKDIIRFAIDEGLLRDLIIKEIDKSNVDTNLYPPVPDWATHFCCGILLHGDGENEVERTEEISK